MLYNSITYLKIILIVLLYLYYLYVNTINYLYKLIVFIQNVLIYLAFKSIVIKCINIKFSLL